MTERENLPRGLRNLMEFLDERSKYSKARAMQKAARRLRWNKKVSEWFGGDPKSVTGIYQEQKRMAEIRKSLPFPNPPI